MEALSAIIAKYGPEPGFLLLLIFLFALGKSVIFISSVLPPASVTLMLGIVAGKPVLADMHVWAAITLGALLGSILSFHCGAWLQKRRSGNWLPARYHGALHNAKSALQKNGIPLLFIAFFGCDALHRTFGRRYDLSATQAGLLCQCAVCRGLVRGPDVSWAAILSAVIG